MASRIAAAIVIVTVSTAPMAFAQAIDPSTTTPSTTTPATTRASADVTPAAEPVLAKLAAAYASAPPLRVEAKIAGTFDVAGRARSYTMAVTSHTQDGARFLHHAAGFGLAVSNGKRGFIFDEKRRAYATLEVATSQPSAADLDEAISDILLEENAALLPALATNAGDLLRSLATRIDVGPEAAIDGKPHAAVVLTRKDDATVTLWLSPDTGLVRRSLIDYRPLLAARGASKVVAAEVTADFTVAVGAAEDAKAYDWQPPEDADEIVLPREMMQSPMRGPRRRGPTTQPSTQPADTE